MKFRRISFTFFALSAVLLTFVLFPYTAFAGPSTEAPELYAYQAAIIVDEEGNKLWGYNENAEMPMASITKVMTAVVCLESDIALDSTTTVSKHELPDYSQLAGLGEGETYTIDQLMSLMLVFSANDAAVMVGRAVGGDDESFVDMMNKKASELGMSHTHFANAHGLETEGHYSCAADLVKLGKYALEKHPYIARTVILESVTIPIRGEEQTFETTDALIGTYSGVRGIKTGKTENGCTFLGCAERSNVRYYNCVLGCDTSEIRFDNIRRMFDWAFSAFNQESFVDVPLNLNAAPYAYRYGLWVPVTYVGNAYGLVDTTGATVSYSGIATSNHMLVEANQALGAKLWEQDGRTVAATAVSAQALRLGNPQPFGPGVSSLMNLAAPEPSALEAA